MKASSNPSDGRASWIAPATGLLASAFMLSLLAVYQWMELLVVDLGGTPSCAIDARLNCAAVWSSSFAKQIQSLTHVPVAGWGLIFGTAAFGSTLAAWIKMSQQRDAEAPIAAVKILGAAGIAASVVFAGISVSLGALCLTCLGTYLLATAFFILSTRMPGSFPPKALGEPMLRATGAVVAAYLVFLGFGLRTPLGPPDALRDAKPAPSASTAPSSPATPVSTAGSPSVASRPGEASHSQDPLVQLLAGLPPGLLQPISNGLDAYRHAQDQGSARFPVRFRGGAPSAPVSLVEFTDIKCGHCAALNKTLEEIERLAPAGAFAIEPRQFPLASECNPRVPFPDPSGVRCLAAKVRICIEGQDGYWAAQSKMFDEQESLTPDRVLAIASEATGKKVEELRTCARSREVEAKLFDDISYASAYDIKGTPLVLLNGRETRPIGPLLYALLIAKGDPEAPGFRSLPPPLDVTAASR
jgi:serine/threonine-protein kinase